MAQNVVPVTLGSPRFSRRDLGSLRVTEAVFPPRAELPLHRHERPIMAVILEGSWDERIGGRLFDCLPGSVLIEPAEERHVNRFSPGGSAGFGDRAGSFEGGAVPALRPDARGSRMFR